MLKSIYFNLRSSELIEKIVLVLRVHSEADTRASSSSASLPLLSTGAADPELLQALHLVLGVVADLLYLTRVHNESQAVDSHRSLGDVSRQDALSDAFGRHVKHPVLVVDRQRAVKRQDDPATRLLCVLFRCLVQRLDV